MGEEPSGPAPFEPGVRRARPTDRGELVRFLKSQDPAQVQRLFLVHGAEHALHALAERFRQEGFPEIAIPAQGQGFDL